MYVHLTGCYTQDLLLLQALAPYAHKSYFWTTQAEANRLVHVPEWLHVQGNIELRLVA